jgi:hypothetical protein
MASFVADSVAGASLARRLTWQLNTYDTSYGISGLGRQEAIGYD